MGERQFARHFKETSWVSVIQTVTWSGYARDRLRKDFLEVLLPLKYSKTRETKLVRRHETSKKFPCALFQGVALSCDQLSTCESIVVARQWGDNVCHETSRLQFERGAGLLRRQMPMLIFGQKKFGGGFGVPQPSPPCNLGGRSLRKIREIIDTEYDRAKVPPYNGNDPRPPLVV